MGKSKTNILLLGSSGAGKSTLINSVFDMDVATTGNFGGGKTQTLKIYSNDILNYSVIDTKGLELGYLAQVDTLRQVSKYIKDVIEEGDADAAIDVIWYCVDAQGKRFFKQNVNQILSVYRRFPNVPVIIVLTKSYCNLATRLENENAVKEVIKKYDQNRKIKLKGIISVNSAPFQSANDDTVAIYGIEELITNTNQILPEAKRTSEANMQLGKKKLRTKQANITVATCTAGAVAVGAAPIPIADAPILVVLQTGMIKAITKLYDVDSSLIVPIITEASFVSTTAKMTLSGLKAIPGINIAGAVLNAFVAGTFTAAVGETTVVICEQIVAGTIDLNDVEKLKGLVTEKIEVMLPKIQSKLTELDISKIDIKQVSEIVSSFFKKK